MAADDATTLPTFYRPSFSNGIYGSYPILDLIEKSHPYYPSISNGIFGTYLYDKISAMNGVASMDIDTDESKESSTKYKFERRGPRNDEIVDGKKYNVTLLQEYQLPTGSKMSENSKGGTGTLYICKGSVVTCSAEAIVNAANQGMLGGGGVDGAITSAGGDALDYLRRSVPVIPNTKGIRCRTGDAKMTQSGYPYNQLKCDFVIHAVGPNYGVQSRIGKKMEEIDALLYSAYAQSMKLCQQHGIQSLGFCLISSGIFRGSRSLTDVLQIGVQAIRDHMFEGIEVFLIGYNRDEIRILQKVAEAVCTGKPLKKDEGNSWLSGLSSWAQKKMQGDGKGKGKGTEKGQGKGKGGSK